MAITKPIIGKRPVVSPSSQMKKDQAAMASVPAAGQAPPTVLQKSPTVPPQPQPKPQVAQPQQTPAITQPQAKPIAMAPAPQARPAPNIQTRPTATINAPRLPPNVTSPTATAAVGALQPGLPGANVYDKGTKTGTTTRPDGAPMTPGAAPGARPPTSNTATIQTPIPMTPLGNDADQNAQALQKVIDQLMGGQRDTTGEEALVQQLLGDRLGKNLVDARAGMGRAGFGASGALGAMEGDIQRQAYQDALGQIFDIRKDARQENLDRLGLGSQFIGQNRDWDMANRRFGLDQNADKRAETELGIDQERWKHEQDIDQQYVDLMRAIFGEDGTGSANGSPVYINQYGHTVSTSDGSQQYTGIGGSDQGNPLPVDSASQLPTGATFDGSFVDAQGRKWNRYRDKQGGFWSAPADTDTRNRGDGSMANSPTLGT